MRGRCALLLGGGEYCRYPAEEEGSMRMTRLSHAVLDVRDIECSVAFYIDVLGFRRIDMTPEGFAGAAFLQAPGSTNDHDLGLFEIGADAGRSVAGLDNGRQLHHAWRGISRLWRAEAAGDIPCRQGRPRRFVGPRHDKEPLRQGSRRTGIEIAGIVPADQLDDAARQARRQIGRLDLDRETSPLRRRYPRWNRHLRSDPLREACGGGKYPLTVAAVQAACVLMDRVVTTSKVEEPVRSRCRRRKLG